MLPHRNLRTLVTLALVFGCASALAGDAGKEADASARAEQFKKEMELADEAPDRDSQIAHWRKALSLRPDHPENIVIEYRIAVELSQRWDPKFPDQVPRRREALALYEALLQKYDHMKYYEKRCANYTWSPQLIVPRAAVHAGCLNRALNRDSRKAREYLSKAMGCLNQTYEKRKEDWANEPPPPEVRLDDPFGGPLRRGKWKVRLREWQERRKKAAEGDVFGPLEMSIVKAAVRQFGYTFGKQRSHEVPVAMSRIIQRYPGTPMAKVAHGHIDRAMKLTEKELYTELPEKELGIEPVLEIPRPSDQTPAHRTPEPSKPAPSRPAVPSPVAQSTAEASPRLYVILLGAAVVIVAAAGVILLVRKRRRAAS